MYVMCVCVCVCVCVLGASTSTEVQETEGGQVLASPETPDASPALAVGSYQKFSQFWAALEADIYPGKRVIFLT